MTTTVSIVDYGSGNLLNVARALEHFDAKVILADTPEQIINADKLILPGVGAFSDAMMVLNQRHLNQAIVEYCDQGKPLLGICLGMQLLLESSMEFGFNPGLGLIPGSVVPIPTVNPQGDAIKIPHIAWSELQPGAAQNPWEHSVLKNTAPNSSFYFIHSFMVTLKQASHCLAVTDYEGITITAMLKHNNITACQFHPEKSGEKGLELIKRFIQEK